MENKEQNFIIHDLTLVAPDRNRKDIANLKTAVITAESVHYPSRVQLYDLYHDLLSMDGYLKGIVEKRINSVVNKKIKFTNSEGQEDENLTKLITSLHGRELIKKIIESELWGISGVEFKIGEEFELQEIPRKHIKPEKGIIGKSQYSISEADGFKYDDMPMVWVIGNKTNLGLLLTCSLYAVYKRGNWGDWAQYIEIFGQPVRIAYYDAYDNLTKEELRKALTESGTSLALMLPKQAQFELKDGKASNGDGKLQDTFKTACNEEMAIAILGNTETTSSSKSSGYAQSKEHGEQQDEITASDLIMVENHLNSKKFFAILKSYGFNPEGGKFAFELELNLAKLKQRLEIDTIVCEKVPIEDDYWYNTYGIPKPKNYLQLKKQMQERQKPNEVIPDKNDTKEEKQPKEKPPKGTKENVLEDKKKKRLMDGFLNILADFFDQAQH
ncbi:hypothetical protein BWK59_05795 [Flavobacterium davisii]|uniref:DUF935 family protein n=1 Tax=Flavobacterium davisii TaxID=2906077 RepID=A0A2D0AII8_9FLAO|nr:DUF935 family protein [Flavobacterium davisii]OWP84335.1 hypothetical protein BWK59_05795 [Flavobacterium davisii]